jgi:anti-sigma B factor antagonist
MTSPDRPEPAIHVRHADLQPPTVVIRGEVDHASTGELQACFDQVLAVDTGVINVDLSDVEFIDSSALNVVAQAYRKLRGRDGRLVVTGASPVATRVLEITGLAPFLLPPTVPGDGAPHPD